MSFSVVFAAERKKKDPHLHYSTMMSWSQLHPCVLLLLPVVCSEAAQPAIGRLWSQPHNVPPVSEAWNRTPALRRQSAVTVHEEHRRQNRGLRSPSVHGPSTPRGPQPLMQRAQGEFGSHLVFTASPSPSGRAFRHAVAVLLNTMQRQNVQQVAERATKNQNKTLRKLCFWVWFLPCNKIMFLKNDIILLFLIDVSSILD